MTDCVCSVRKREPDAMRKLTDTFGADALRHGDWPISVSDVDDAVSDVLVMMVGVVCTPAQCGAAADEYVCAEIRMTGAREGRCLVELPVEAGDWLTDSLMGSDADWDDEMIHDAVGELCNMITGGVKRRLGSWLGECRISLPEVSRIRAQQRERARSAGMRRVYHVGGTTVAVTIEFYRTTD